MLFQNRDPEFHKLIQTYVTPEPDAHSSGSYSGLVYSVSAANAPCWIRALKELWLRLQSYLLVDISEEGKSTEFMVKNEAPTTQTVNDIITMMFVLEALLPVFKHLASSRLAAYGLAKAGALPISFAITDGSYADTFPELVERKRSSLGSNILRQNQSIHAKHTWDLDFVPTNDDRKSGLGHYDELEIKPFLQT